MPIHLLMNFSAAVPVNSNGAILGAPIDQAIGVQNGNYQVPMRMSLHGVSAFVPDATRVRLEVPSQRVLGFPVIDPLNPSPPALSRPALNTYDYGGPMVEASEEIRWSLDRTGAAPLDCFVASWWTTAGVAPARGSILTVRCTSSIVTAKGGWGLGALTLDQTLNVGNWDVVGIQTYGANVLASRLVFFNSQLRPGGLARESQGSWNEPVYRNGNAGLLGQFSNFTLPQLEVFGWGTTSTQVTYLDLIKR